MFKEAIGKAIGAAISGGLWFCSKTYFDEKDSFQPFHSADSLRELISEKEFEKIHSRMYDKYIVGELLESSPSFHLVGDMEELPRPEPDHTNIVIGDSGIGKTFGILFALRGRFNALYVNYRENNIKDQFVALYHEADSYGKKFGRIFFAIKEREVKFSEAWSIYSEALKGIVENDVKGIFAVEGRAFEEKSRTPDEQKAMELELTNLLKTVAYTTNEIGDNNLVLMSASDSSIPLLQAVSHFGSRIDLHVVSPPSHISHSELNTLIGSDVSKEEYEFMDSQFGGHFRLLQAFWSKYILCDSLEEALDAMKISILCGINDAKEESHFALKNFISFESEGKLSLNFDLPNSSHFKRKLVSKRILFHESEHHFNCAPFVRELLLKKKI
eukprot:TRINITY_DN782_c0_g1_i2.p1 TRINITY_DN782_c0_g1~~TRINITY_DN782_c0_g1_i2.p1  ORF type:complete len:386 (-),score=103.93 TRINITY_DN782_c0_g1_i2:377-1534(-)